MNCEHFAAVTIVGSAAKNWDVSVRVSFLDVARIGASGLLYRAYLRFL